MIETIILPLDGSELAEAALPVALELQEKLSASLILLRVIEPPALNLKASPAVFEPPAGVAADIELAQQVEREEHNEAERYLLALLTRLGGERRESVVVEASAADAIVELARSRPGALVVMASHGRGGLGRIVFGSVADAVLRRSSVPVTLVPRSV